MELTCKLSALVYAELYALLGEERDWTKLSDERLAELGRQPEWRDHAVQRYEALWALDSSCAEAEQTASEDRMDAELATWIIAALRHTGPSDAFSSELAGRVRDRFRRQFPHGPLPAWFDVSVVAWTLGRVCGQIDRTTPVTPAEWPDDADVTAAYRGLLDHVNGLPEETPWPEMRGSSILLRVAGLAEGLSPRLKLEDCLAGLTNDSLLPSGLADRLRGSWGDFVKMRNGFAHVRPKVRGYGLGELATQFCDGDAVRTYVQAATHFVCSAVGLQLTFGTRGRESMLVDPLDGMGWALSA